MRRFNYSLILVLLMFSCNSSEKKTENNNQNSNEKFSEGKQVYHDFCIQCHMANGEGTPKIFPPLADSDFLKNKRIESIKAIKYGMSGEVIINGEKYNGVMATQGLTNKEIADVMNYITNSWNNSNKTLITEEEVSKVEH